MPFHELLNGILLRKGVHAAVFMDSQGEVILSRGELDSEKLHLVGAYQAILLTSAERLGFTPNRTIVTICNGRSILTHHLKDGYFISVVFSPEENYQQMHFQLEDAYRRLMEEL